MFVGLAVFGGNALGFLPGFFFLQRALFHLEVFNFLVKVSQFRLILHYFGGIRPGCQWNKILCMAINLGARKSVACAAENTLKRIIMAGGDRIKLMIVAPRADR